MRPLPELTARNISNFNSHVVPLSNGCRVWTGHTNERGYGTLNIRGRVYRANRIAWKIKHGADPGDLHVLHECDTPACVEHLFLGTHADNMRDMRLKGRTDRLRKARGEEHYNSRLTVADVLAIRQRYAGGESQTSLARSFGVHRITIFDITHNRTWRHV